MVTAGVTMIGFRSAEVEALTRPLLERWTEGPVTVIDNTVTNIPLTDLWNRILGASRADVHVLLNADVFVTPGWLPPLLAAFEQDPKVAVAGPGSNEGPQTLDIDKAPPGRFPPSEWLVDAAKRAQERFGDEIRDREIFGFCYAVRRSSWLEVGGFDPTIPFYGNDAAYNVQIRARGLRVVKVCGSYVWHVGGYSVEASRRR